MTVSREMVEAGGREAREEEDSWFWQRKKGRIKEIEEEFHPPHWPFSAVTSAAYTIGFIKD